MAKRVMLSIEVLLILLCGLMALAFIEFIAIHKRLPVGSGEVWNWVMGLTR